MSLVDSLIRAQSGYRSDVAALVDQLKKSDVFAPLQASGNLPSKPSTLTVDTSVALHNLPSADGAAWIALFSSIEALRRSGERHKWFTDRGPLRYVGFKWDAGIEGMFLKALESGSNAGIVFDEGSRSELGLRASEVLSIARGEVIPLVDYTSRQPTRGKEQVFVGEPAAPPPQALLEAVQSTLSTERVVTSHHLRQVYMPERDVMPHLILDIESTASEPERRRISHRVGEAIKNIELPPPGYLDIAFNFNRR
jgi:hypothetical protein